MIALAAFLAITGGCLAMVYRVLSWKDTMGPYLSSVEQLYATPKNRIDALFVGSSHCYAAVNPDVMWRDYGIAAFDMAISGQDRTETLHYTMEALQTQSPRVVVADLLAVTFEKGVESNRYRNLLSMRSSMNRLAMIMDDPVENKADYLLRWPIIHTRYRELTPYDFISNPYNSYGRGYCYRFAANEVIHTPGMEDLPDAIPISEANRKWINDFVALSETEGFTFLPVILPHEMTQEEKEIYNGVLAYLDELEVPYLDLNHMMGQLELSYLTDFMDSGHLNYYGGEKVSDFFGEMLRDEFGLQDHRGDPAYAQWDDSLAYAQHLIRKEELSVAGTAEEYLAGLAQMDMLTVITRTAGADGRVTLSVTDGEETEQWSPESPVQEETVRELDRLHVLSITLKENGYSAEINGEPVFAEEPGTAVCVFDHRLGEQWGTHGFDR